MVNDWNKLEEVDRTCRLKGVSWELFFGEASGEYYITIHSAAWGEQWFGKPLSFDASVENAMKWLNSL